MEQISDKAIMQAFKRTQTEFRCSGGKLELITDECSPDVLTAIKQLLLTDEPLTKFADITVSPDVEGYWFSLLKQGMSFMIVNEEKGDIMGMMIVVKVRRSSYNFDHIKDEKARTIINFAEYTSKHFDVFEHYGVSETFAFNGLRVPQEYRRQGLATLLMETGLKFVDNLQKPFCVQGSATSNISQKIFEKLGFDTLAEFLYEDYKIDGKVVLDNMGEHKSMKIFGKFIK